MAFAHYFIATGQFLLTNQTFIKKIRFFSVFIVGI